MASRDTMVRIGRAIYANMTFDAENTGIWLNLLFRSLFFGTIAYLLQLVPASPLQTAALILFAICSLWYFARAILLFREQRARFVSRWRREHARCVNCGYSLRGLGSARCPECGGAIKD